MATDWNAIRGEFPALKEWTYLNTATFGQMPRCAAEAVARHFARRNRLACTDFMGWFEDCDRIRVRMAAFIHCQAPDIAFIQNASAGLSLIRAVSLGRRATRSSRWKTNFRIIITIRRTCAARAWSLWRPPGRASTKQSDVPHAAGGHQHGELCDRVPAAA